MRFLFPFFVTACLFSFGYPEAPAAPPLVPWPHEFKENAGDFTIGENTKILYEREEWKSLAELFAEEIAVVFGVKPEIREKGNADGNIVFAHDSAATDDGYAIAVDGGARISAKSFQGLAYGTVTLLQSIRARDGGRLSVPNMEIRDRPDFEYRGLMIDVARKYHSPECLRGIVKLCRLYKIRFLHLHLTDDPLWMFPSKAYPNLGGKNQGGVKPYTVDELKSLVAYAEQNGVTIIPEYEVPGHSGAANRDDPDLFQIKGTKPYIHHATINFADEKVLQAVETIIGEMCDVFKPTPYFHVGGDEADFSLAGQNEYFKAAMEKTGLKSPQGLYRKLLGRLDEIVRKHGKKTIVWEGFHRGGNVEVPKDIVVMVYENAFYMPDKLVADGYKIINASWTPMYVVNRKRRDPSEIYQWNARQFKRHGAKAEDRGIVLDDNTNLLGAQMCAWEQPETLAVPSLRFRLPAMAERVWNDRAGKTYEDFESRVVQTDMLFDRLVHRLSVTVTGMTRPGLSQFDEKVTVTATPAPGSRGTVRYALGMKPPGSTSPVLGDSLEFEESTDLVLGLFDDAGKPAGYPRWIRYEKGVEPTDIRNELPGSANRKAANVAPNPSTPSASTNDRSSNIEAPPTVLVQDDFSGKADYGFDADWSNGDFARTGELRGREARRKLAKPIDKTVSDEIWLSATVRLSSELRGEGNIYRALRLLDEKGEHHGFSFAFREAAHPRFHGKKIQHFDAVKEPLTILAKMVFDDSSYRLTVWLAPGDGKTIDPAKTRDVVQSTVQHDRITGVAFVAGGAPETGLKVLRLAAATTWQGALGLDVPPDVMARKAAFQPPKDPYEDLMRSFSWKNGDSIAFFGDSITMQGGYIKMFENALKKCSNTKELKMPIYRHGLNGGRAPTILSGESPWGKLGDTMENLLKKEKPTYVFILVGINDVWHAKNGTSPAEFKASLEKMLTLCQEVDAKVILATPSTIGEKVDGKNPNDKKLDEYCDIIRELAGKNALPLCDLRKAFKGRLKEINADDLAKGVLTNDGVHLNRDGNELVFLELLETLKQIKKNENNTTKNK